MQYTKKQNAALFILRIITAAIFFVAAYYKFPFWSDRPEGMSSAMIGLMKLLSVAEPLGALAVLIGFLTRWAAAGLSIILLGAIYVTKFTYDTGFVTSTGAGWNFPLSVLAGCIILISFGAGDWSVEKQRAKEKV